MSDTPRQYRFGPDAIRTPANVITIMRLLFTIPVLMMILDGNPGSESWTTFTGWLVLWVTDWLDGWLARRDGTTHWGAFLDPLADKILLTASFVMLTVRGIIPFWITRRAVSEMSPWMTWLVTGRAIVRIV